MNKKNNLEDLITTIENYPSLNMDYKTYYEELKEYNQNIHKKLKTILQQTKEQTICLVESDARLEKGYKSKIELVIINNKEREYNFNNYKEVISNIEFKNLEDKTYLFNNDPSKIFPSRIIDLKYLKGNIESFKQIKSKYVKEVQTDYKKLKKVLRDRKKNRIKTMMTGKEKFKKEEITHYNLETGACYYDGKTRLGFKMGPIRAIQTYLTLKITEYLKQTQDTEFLEKLPSNTEEKLEFLEGILIKPKDIEPLIDNYKFFLKEYHRSQKENTKLSIVSYNENQLKEIKNRIYEIKRILT